MRLCPACGSRFSSDVRFCPHDGQPTQEREEQAAPADPLLGQVIDGRYRVESILGEGGMGVVYTITHVGLNKRMAMKVLRGDMAKDPEVVQRFIQEAQTSSSIGHPNIIDISDFGRLPDDSVYFVMEYLEGESLTDRIEGRGPLRVAEAVEIVEQMASALGAAHDHGVVHRDMKPDNVFLIARGGSDDFVKVLDFGIAKVGSAPGKLTRTGMVFGTPHYMSPEQAAGQVVDGRADIYAVGVIMYEMFTGEVPFDAETFMGILTKHMFEDPIPPSRRGAMPEMGNLEAIVLRALAKKPETRYQTMEELLADIETVKAGGSIPITESISPSSAAVVPSVNAAAHGGRTSMVDVVGRAVGRRWPVIVAAVAAVLLLGGAGVGALYALWKRSLGGAIAPAEVATVSPDGAGAEASGDAPPPSSDAAEGSETAPGSGVQPSSTAEGAQPEGEATPSGVAEPPEALVRVDSNPTNAALLVDGTIVGHTPIELPHSVAMGEHTIELRLSGHRDRSLTTQDLQTGEVLAELTPIARRVARAPHRRTMASAMTQAPANEPAPAPAPAPTPMREREGFSEVVDPWE